LLRFKVHQLKLKGRHYLLLPKLNGRQMGILKERLASTGFSVEMKDMLTARSREGTIKISPSGFCSSSLDPSDSVLPVVPDLLRTRAEKVPLRVLEDAYFRTSRSADLLTVRLYPRMECSSLWEAMRASDVCGLAPDEHAVAVFLINRTEGKCALVTDFPVDDAKPRVYGRRRYFNSKLDGAEGAASLRSAGVRGQRNSYLRRDGTMVLQCGTDSPRRDWLELFGTLGEWCFFTPA